MDSLKPVTRDYMQNLMPKQDDLIRIIKVNYIVSQIYSQAIKKATTGTSFRFPEINKSNEDEYFIYENIEEILIAVQVLFPDCSVTKKFLGLDKDGNVYDITNKAVLRCISIVKSMECINIDWS